MVLLGYEPGSAAYRVYDPAAGKVHVSRDVVFDEDAAWNWTSTKKQKGDAADTFTVEHLVIPISGADGSWNTTRSGRAPDMPSENGTRTERAHDVDDHATAGTGNAPSPAPPATPATPPSRTVEFASPPSNASQPSPGEEAPRRYRLLEELYDVTEETEAPGSDLCLLAADEPANFSEAEKDKEWRAAMVEEMASIEANQTWRLTRLPPGHRAIGLKWVFKLKRDSNGDVVKRKARLVAKWYV
jgi:hypothetical protein